jgi:glycosyltransferase involved in cell wall biosynthesis
MKFAFISTMYGGAWGGSEELWSQAAIHLKRSGHDVRASVVYRPHPSDKLAVLATHGIEVETHPPPPYLVGPSRTVWNRVSLSYRRSHNRLKRFRPDLVIISQGHNAGGFDWAKVCRDAAIPYVIIVQCNSELWWFESHVVGKAVESYIGARKVFCVSRHNLDLLRQQVGDPLLNGEVVWNPFNVSFERAPDWPDESDKWRFACVARIDAAAKGQDLLLQVLARPEWRCRPVEVNFYGEGPHEVAFRRTAEMFQLNNAHFRGHVNDVKMIWEQNHLLVLPSRYEGLPLALVEAMWCARPAVVTEVGGNAELCLDGVTGFVAPAATVSSLTDALERAWERRADWQSIGKAARTRVEDLVPKDPAGVFCEQLQACAAAKSATAAG